MRARITPTREDVERINNLAYEQQCINIIDNNIVFMIAMRRAFGLGPKRIQQFLKVFNSTKETFDKYEEEGGVEYFRRKVSEELDEMGIDSSTIWDIDNNYTEAISNQRKKEKSKKPTYSEAKALKENFIHVKRLTE